MQKILISAFALLFTASLFAQHEPIQPFEELGIKVKVLTLSNGKYQESFPNDTTFRFGSVMFNRVTGEVVTVIENDTLYGEYNLKAEVVSRWLSPDPLAHEYSNLSPYVFVANNPIIYIDPDGMQIVDPKGRAVTVTRNEDGSLNYQFDDKTKEKHREQFMAETAPVLAAMNGSEAGWADIQTLSGLDTKVSIVKDDGTNEQNSEVFPLLDNRNNPVMLENGQYEAVTITPYLGNHAVNSSADMNEWLGSVMTVETGHLDPAQIKLEKERGISGNPADEAFTSAYQGLLNQAVRFRGAYRDEKGQPITAEVFAPIEKANAGGAKIKYAPDNQARKDKFDKGN
jgi:RHS repeat-associated protein